MLIDLGIFQQGGVAGCGQGEGGLRILLMLAADGGGAGDCWDSHNGDLAAKVLLDVRVLDRVRRIIGNDLKEALVKFSSAHGLWWGVGKVEVPLIPMSLCRGEVWCFLGSFWVVLGWMLRVWLWWTG